MKAKIYIGAKKYALYIGRKIVQKTLEFLTLPARFVSNKVQELKNYLVYGDSKQETNIIDISELEFLNGFVNATGEYPTQNSSYPNAKYSEVFLNTGDRIDVSATGYCRFRFGTTKGIATGNITIADTANYTSTISGASGNEQDGYIIAKVPMYILLLKISDAGVFTGTITHTTPTPQTPIPVESVGDRTKNLFNKNNIVVDYRLSSGIKHEYSKDTDFVSAINYYVSSLVEVKVGKTYTKNSPNEDASHRYHIYNEDKICVRLANENTITINDGEKYVAFCGKIEELDNTQIEEGIQSTPYEPYGYKVPVTVGGKNLFNKSNAINVNGSIQSNGEISYNTGAGTFEIEIKPNTKYSISIDSSLNTSIFRIATSNIKLTKNETIQGTSVLYGTNQKTATFTTDSTAKYLYFQTNKAMFDTVAQSLQLEQGSTATPYQPYIEPTTTNIYLNEPLRKIGEYADYIDFDNQKVVRNVKGVKFGELNIAGYEEQYRRYSVQGITDRLPIVIRTGDGFSTAFKLWNMGGSANDVANNYFYWGEGKSMFIVENVIKDNVQMKQLLAEQYVYYPLATPIEEQITLPAINLEQGTLTIDTDTKIKPSKIILTGDIDNE